MKKHVLLFATVGLAFSVCAAGATPGARECAIALENPGFETGATGWDRLPRNAAIDTTVAHGGAASVSLTVADPAKETVYITRRVPVVGGADYKASCFVKTENVVPRKGRQPSVGAGLIVEWYDRSGKWMAGGEYACDRFGTKDWERAACNSLRAPSKAGSAQIFLALRGAGKAWFDDVTFTALEWPIALTTPAAEATLACNTPCFAWQDTRPVGADYVLELSRDRAFPANATRVYRVRDEKTFQLQDPLEPGTWYWRVQGADARAFHQTAPVERDCLPPEIRTRARRVLVPNEAFTVAVRETGSAEPPRVTFAGVTGTCGARDTNGVYVVTFAAPAGGWAPGLTERTLVATDAAGNVASNAFWLLNRPKPANDVVIDAHGDFVEAGKRIFPLGIYEVHKQDMREVRDAGFDVVHTYRWEGDQNDVACRTYLDDCWAANGLRAFIGFDRGTRSKAGIVQGNLAHLAHRVGALADHPGLFCWYLFDEPEIPAQYVSPERLTACADLVRALDPFHPVVMTTWNKSMIDYRRTWDTHWSQAYGNPAEVVKLLAEQRGFLHNASPITLLVNCNDKEQGKLRRTGVEPDPAKFARDYDHLRACAFLGIVKECNGVWWWWFARRDRNFYSAAQNPKAWADLVKIVKELGALRPLVTAPGLVVTGTVADGENTVEWWRKTVDGRDVLIAVNTGTGPATVTIGGRSLTFRRYEVKVEGATVDEARLTWKLADGSTATEVRPLETKGDESGLAVSAAEIRAKKAKCLVVTPSFGHAVKGEAGYWFSPYGYYGEWDCEKGTYVAERERMSMPMYGWATPRGAYLAIITGLAHYPRLRVEAKGGQYSVSCELTEELCKEATEDFRVEFHRRAPGTGYGALAAIYRDHQIARGAVKPLAERVKTNPVLKRAVEAPEIRIRQAWKPVPSPVKWQTPTNEPPVKPVITFDRLQDIVRELKRQGVAGAELCLVGWNIGGHDGRWPQYFPAEPKLGGDAGLKAVITCARDAGYLIVPHGNFIEGYTIANNWDWANAAKNEKGEPQLAGSFCWGGGQPVRLCPRRAYEVYCTGLMKQLAEVGFTGVGYFDVVSILHGTNCFDPAHPCTRAEGAAWWGKYAAAVQKTLGGFASEGAVDHFAGNLDSVLYASFDSAEKIAARHAKGGLAKTHVPIFQLVYNGIIVQNPFTTTVNFTAQPRSAFLKFLEYGGRPNFYFYSKFLTDPKRDWMGKNDLRCGTDEELRWSVGKIREGAEIYAKLRHLQYAFMTNHERLAPGVARTTWSTGESILVNDTDAAFTVNGTTIPAHDWKLQN